MIRLGKVQELKVVREKAFGVYLGEDEKSESSVLLPKRQVPEGTKVAMCSRCSSIRIPRTG